jgi:hypothetical protein
VRVVLGALHHRSGLRYWDVPGRSLQRLFLVNPPVSGGGATGVDPVTSDPDGCLNLTMETDLAGYVSASFQCATAMVGRRMIARLVAKRAEASPLVRTWHRSLTALGPCLTASFHLSHHLGVCVRSFLPHRPVFSPLLVGRSVAPT